MPCRYCHSPSKGHIGVRMPMSRDLKQRDVNTRSIYNVKSSDQTGTQMQSI